MVPARWWAPRRRTCTTAGCAALDEHATALALIGTPRYVGADPGLAQLWYQAQLDVFLTALSGLLHATALVGSAGVTAPSSCPRRCRR